MTKRFVTVWALICLLCISMAGSANAAEPTFLDVHADSPWYEAITYAAAEGITNGTTSDTFEPDRYISVRQWAVMICRAYDKKPVEIPNAEFGMNCIDLGFAEGWLDIYALGDPDMTMTRKTLYESMFDALDMKLYDPRTYEDPTLTTQTDLIMRVAVELGLCEPSTNPSECVSRGEAVFVLYKLASFEVLTYEPPILGELKIQNKDGVDLTDYLIELLQIPEIIIDSFDAAGWEYHVDRAYLADLSIRYDMNCIGATSYQKKTVYAWVPEATIHEFGHYYHLVEGFPSEFDSIYEAEHKNASGVLGSYSTRNALEYFAEAFDYWILSQDNSEKLAALKAVAPKTYEYFDSCEKRGWID